MESSKVAEKEPSAPAETRSRLPAARPKSLALAEQAANLVHAAYEAGYTNGFSAGRLAGLDKAVEIVHPTYPPNGKPF